MLIKLFLLFTVTPLVELALLIEIGSFMGVVPTIGLVLITGAVGALLARSQGLAVIQELNEKTSKGEMPTDQIADGLMILVGGVLLVTPGIITDLLGFLLVVPTTRRAIRDFVKSKIIADIQFSSFVAGSRSSHKYYPGSTNDPRIKDTKVKSQSANRRSKSDDIIDI
ncbi:MAG TPA: FxsA family protein [Nitrospinota bacterium]|jgi:UPF0716 protein FxsA|nr:FxsA family protein [Nitrospinota bacterium]|tara:strand:+ start:5353 stop:5856 length:504 start_codon:yes stop_codon:yes gene_type:complete